MNNDNSLMLMNKGKIDNIKEHLQYTANLSEVFFLFIEDSPQASSLLQIASVFKNLNGIKVINFSQFYSIISPHHNQAFGKSNCLLFIFNLLSQTDKEEGLLLLEYYASYCIKKQSFIKVIASYKKGLCQFVQMLHNENITTSNIIFIPLTDTIAVLNNIESLYNYLLNFYFDEYHYSLIWTVELKIEYNEGIVYCIDNSNLLVIDNKTLKNNDNCLTYTFDFINQVDLSMQHDIVTYDNTDNDCLSFLKKLVCCCNNERRLNEVFDSLAVPKDFLNNNKEIDMVVKNDKEESLLSSDITNDDINKDCNMIKIPIDINPMYLSLKLMGQDKKNKRYSGKDNDIKGNKDKDIKYIHVFTSENIEDKNSFDNKFKIYKGQGPVVINFKDEVHQRGCYYFYLQIDNTLYKVVNPFTMKIYLKDYSNGVYLYE